MDQIPLARRAILPRAIVFLSALSLFILISSGACLPYHPSMPTPVPTPYYPAPLVPIYVAGTPLALSHFSLQPAWTVQLNNTIMGPPRYAQGRVWVENVTPSVTYFAFRVEDGQPVWSYDAHEGIPEPEDAYFLSGVSGDNLVFAPQHGIEAISLATGQRVWTASSFNPSVSLAFGPNTVFVSSKDGIVALDATTGTQKWEVSDTFVSKIFYNDLTHHIIAPGSIAYSVIDAGTGQILYALDDTDYGHVGCGPNSMENLQLYFGRIYCHTVAFNAENGQYLAGRPMEESFNFPTPLINADSMYLPTVSGSIKRLALQTLAVQWEFVPASTNGQSVGIASNIVINKGVGYAIANDATLRAFRIDTGQEVGRWQAPKIVYYWHYGSGALPRVGVDTDGTRIFASFGTDTLYTFMPTYSP